MSKITVKCTMPEWSRLGRLFGDLMYSESPLRELVS